jgi:DNA (cytosine-5)-methyltransferase 3A
MDKKHNYQIIQLERGFNKGGIHKDKSPAVPANSFEQNNLVIQLNPSTESGGVQPYQQNRVYDTSEKSPALISQMSCSTHAIKEKVIRRLTPTECARLQTIPAWYKWECSDTQIYRMLGNGWTIEAIKHIIGFLDSHQRNK